MNKRQRKKNRIGEFVVYGFEIEAVLRDPAATFDSLIMDEFIPFVEKHHLGFGGGLDRSNVVTGYVTGYMPTADCEHERCGHCSSVSALHPRERSCTEEDRALVLDWFIQHPNVESMTAGPLVDAWR